MNDLEKIRLEFVARALKMPNFQNTSWEEVIGRANFVSSNPSLSGKFEQARVNLTAQMGWLPRETSWAQLVKLARKADSPSLGQDYSFRG